MLSSKLYLKEPIEREVSLNQENIWVFWRKKEIIREEQRISKTSLQ